VAPKVNVKKDNKVRKTINVQVKQEIIEKHERVSKVNALDIEYCLPQSTIYMIMLLFMIYLFIIYPCFN
jgi:hypothetical protein